MSKALVVSEAATFTNGAYLFGVVRAGEAEVYVDGEYCKCLKCNITTCNHAKGVKTWILKRQSMNWNT